MLSVKETARVRISKIVKVSEKYATVFGSSSSKNKTTDQYEYSNWTIKFVGNARKAFELVSEGSVITLTSAALTNVPYENKEGDKVWQNVQLLVFDFEVYRNGTGSTGAEIPDEDDIPF